MTSRVEKILRNQLEDNPEVVGPWEFSAPGYVVFVENLSDEVATLNIKGGESIDGPFVRQYGSDAVITIQPRARIVPAVITDVPKFVALHLDARIGDGVKVELVSYQTLPSHELARERLSVT